MRSLVRLGLCVAATSACSRITVDKRDDSGETDESSSDPMASEPTATFASNGEGEDVEGPTAPSPPQAHHYSLTRFDGGAETWTMLGPEGFFAVAAGPHPDGGSVLATRQSRIDLPSALARFDADGVLLAELELAAGVSVSDLVIDATGVIYVAGDVPGGIGYAAYDADFAELWPITKTENVSTGVSRRIHVALGPDGRLVFATSTEGSASMRRLDADGTPSWTSTWPGAAAPEAVGSLADLVVSAGGDIILVIDTGDAESGDLWLDAFDPDGNEIWTASQPDTYATGVAVTSAGTVIAAGIEIFFAEGTRSAWLGAYSGNGTLEWDSRSEIEAAIGPVRACTEGFVFTLDGARVFSEEGVELDVLVHEEPGGVFAATEAFCAANGGVMLLGNVTFET